MTFTLRIDLDCVPWDRGRIGVAADAEAAMILKLLEMARVQGLQYHFFASNRVIRALPSAIDAALDDHHDLDWLYDGSGSFTEELATALELIKPFDYAFNGLASDNILSEELPEWLTFSSLPEPCNARNYPATIRLPNLSLPDVLPENAVIVIRPYQLTEAQNLFTALSKLIDQLIGQGRQLKTLRQI